MKRFVCLLALLLAVVLAFSACVGDAVQSGTSVDSAVSAESTEASLGTESTETSLDTESEALDIPLSSEDEASVDSAVSAESAEISLGTESSEPDISLPSEDETSEVEYPEGAYIIKSFTATDSVEWENVPKADISIYKWVDSVEYEAYAQLVYVTGYGFLCRMTCMESDPPAQYTQFGDPVYLDSCMEFFAAWDNKSYINLECNSIGTLCAQFGRTKANRKSATDFLPMEQMFIATPVVEENYWELTIDIPIEKLQRFYGSAISAETFVSGYSFKGNFYKIGSDPETGVRHYGMWNEVNTKTPDFHQPNYFGTLVIE